MSDTLSNSELDVLDGFEKPSLKPNSTPSVPRPVTPIEVARNDAENKDGQFAVVLAALQEQLASQETLDPLTGEAHITGEGTTNGEYISIEDLKGMHAHLTKQIAEVRNKTTILKDAINIRQASMPVVIEFDPKTNSLLHRGMIRIFDHSSGTITYDQYVAAIEARSELSKRFVDTEVPDIHTIIGDNNVKKA